MRCKELVVDGDKIVLRETELPEPSGAQVLIRNEFSNISIGTELSSIRDIRKTGSGPLQLGYSAVGEIIAAGPEARDKKGQRVLTLTPHSSHVIIDDVPGEVIPVPDTLDPSIATFGTIASIAMHIVERAQPRLGETVMVYGCGLVGAFTLLFLGLSGLKWIGLVEPDGNRRSMAADLGDIKICSPGEMNELEWLRSCGMEEGIDIAIETAGHPSVFPSVLNVLKTNGRLVCSSTFLSGLSVPLYPVIIQKELTVIGAHQPKCPPTRVPYYPHSQQDNRVWALDCLDSKRIDASGLLTHLVPWEETPEFYRTLEVDRTVLGAVIDWRSHDH